MKNKVLVELYVVDINVTYNLYIPVNEYVGHIIKLVLESAYELVDIEPENRDYYLYDPDTGLAYENSKLVRETNIKNAKKIYLI